MTVLAPLSASAQESSIHVGLDIAPVFTSMRGNEMVENLDSRLVLQYGLFARYQLNQWASVESGLYYHPRGVVDNTEYMDEFGNVEAEVTYTFKYNYLSVPLVVNASTDGQYYVYASAGIHLSVLLNAQTVLEFDDDRPTATYEYGEYTKWYDYGFVYGAGAGMNISDRLGLSIGLTGSLGLANTSKVATINDGSLLHDTFGVAAKLSYRLR